MSNRLRAGFLLVLFLNTLATLNVVCFYLSRVPSALDILAYEQGRERLPFQRRTLMMLPLRWAHHSSVMVRVAAALTRMPGWFPSGTTPEVVLQGVIDLAAIVCTGLITRRIYSRASRTGLFAPFVYPLTLSMITVTYALQTSHAFRFIYDLPAMAFFAAGLYLLHIRGSVLLFAAIFVIATVNRETTLLLLPVYWIRECLPANDQAPTLHLVHSRPGRRKLNRWRWSQLWTPKSLALSLPLLAWWIGWHIWVVRHFAGNPSATGPRFLLNLATLLCPLAWPQLVSVAAFLWPFTIAYRRLIPDPTLRAWVWLPAIWLALMLFYGLLIETRIFGELISYFACTTLLIAEQLAIKKLSFLEESCDLAELSS